MSILDRRKFLKTSSLTAVAVGSAPFLESYSRAGPSKASQGKYMGGFVAPKLETIRVALIGVGARGYHHLALSASNANTEIVGICDLYEDLVSSAHQTAREVEGNRHQDVALYFGGETKWRQMLEEVQPDVVIISTNWANHATMAVESMNQGAHAFVEVPMAVRLDELWNIIDTSERTQRHCMMMENVNYGREELMYLNMCRKGVIGELLHGEAAYIHELRFQMDQVDKGTGSWRTHHYVPSGGNLYPTHGLGPVAQYMSLARGEDNFRSLVSYSTPAAGRKLHAEREYASDHKWNNLQYNNGDMNTSIIKTQVGRTILVQWDETSPRPYTRHNLIQGTKGTLAGFPTRVALESGVDEVSEDHHSWVEGEDLDSLFEKYDHPLYKRLQGSTKKSGHGGMDGLMNHRILECLKKGEPLDQNVYEGCFWSAVISLSQKSVAQDGAPQKFPDFTRGGWKTTAPLGIVG